MCKKMALLFRNKVIIYIKGTRGIRAYFRRVSRCEDGCLESSEEASALELQRVALVWPSVRSLTKVAVF